MVVLRANRTRPITDPKSYIRRKLSKYFGENRTLLSKFYSKKACIVISDNTRFAFNNIIVPIVVEELLSMGIRGENITLLVATGLHRPMSHADLLENLGREVVGNFRIEQHDPNGETASLGRTSRGTPVLVNKGFMQADLKIATGLVAPHFHAGFGGGYKSILPGISGRISILKNHSFDMVGHEKARYGVLSGNPIYEDITEAGMMSGLNLIVNAAVDPDKNMTHLFIGEPQLTHRKAAETVAKEMKVEFDGLFDIVVTTNGGFPLDRNLYQCVKGAAIGELMTKQGGAIVLAGQCRDGVGHETFQKYLSYGKDPQDVLDKLKSEEPVEDQDNIQILARVLTRADVIVVTGGIRPDLIRRMKMRHAPSVREALRACGWPQDKDLKIAVVPGGPYVLPVGAQRRENDN
jgi:nickel-dependent lactate racemase